MSAVAVQLPAVGADGKLEVEATAGAASTSNAPVTDANDLMPTTKPSPGLNQRGQARHKTLRSPLQVP
jgi:hypothetical protein